MLALPKMRSHSRNSSRVVAGLCFRFGTIRNVSLRNTRASPGARFDRKTLPPIVDLAPMTVSPPRIVDPG